MFDEKFDPVKAVLINVTKGDIEEISLDISSKTSQVAQYLGGVGSFIGQWIDKDIVIMRRRDPSTEPINCNKLAKPFRKQVVMGPILLIRMDENSEPKDLTLEEVLESKLVLSTPPRNTACR